MNVTKKQYHGLNLDLQYWHRIISSYVFHINDRVLFTDEVNGRLIAMLEEPEKNRINIHRHNLINECEKLDLNDEYQNIHFMTEPAMNIINRIKIKDNGYREIMKLKDIDINNGKIVVNKEEVLIYHTQKGTDGEVLVVLYSKLTDTDDGKKALDFHLFMYRLSTGEILVGNYEMQDFADDLFRKLILFLYYTDKTTELIKGNQSNNKPKNKGKIKNSTPYNITFVDSKFNVDVVRTDGFNVSGHFRLQPYGNNDNRRYNIIYIQPFRKNGYIRKATKESIKVNKY